MDTCLIRVTSGVFIWRKENYALFYNSSDSTKYELEMDEFWYNFVLHMEDVTNLYCIELNKETISEPNISRILRKMEELGLIEISEDNLNDVFISFPPVLSLQKSKEAFLRDRKILEFENFMSYIRDVTIYINGETSKISLPFRQTQYIPEKGDDLNYSDLKLFLKKISRYTILSVKLTGHALFDYYEWEDLINELDAIHAIKYLYITSHSFVSNLENIKKITSEQFCFRILVDKHFPLDEKIADSDDYTNSNIEFVFLVSDEDDWAESERAINKYAISNYKVKPLYDGSNLSFFSDNIYLSAEDIAKISLTKRDVFTHQVMNTNFFGRLTVLQNGDMYTNLNFPAVGNIKDADLKNSIYEELMTGSSWLKIRSDVPCSRCLYQYLCPSPSNYELVIGKPNLCHIKP